MAFPWIGKSKDGETVTLHSLKLEHFQFAERPSDPSCIRLGAVVDVETTGLHLETAEIIEIGLRLFEFNRDTGQVLSLGQSYTSYQDPGVPIDPEVTALTGITDEMVKGTAIDWAAVDAHLNIAQVIIAHNAGFDRPFIDRRSSVTAKKIWACSFKQLDWSKKGYPSQKLEVLSIYHGFFTGAHRAQNDVDALLYLLSLPDHTQDYVQSAASSRPYLFELLQNAKTPTARVLAVGAPFESKDTLKGRKYSWDGQNRYWKKEITQDQVREEIAFLESQVYFGSSRAKIIDVPLEDRFKKEANG